MREITLGMALYHINKEAKRVLEESGDRSASGRYYALKNFIIQKINKKPVDAHIFPIGKMYVYEVDGFTFHHKYSNGYDIEASKEINAISSEDKLCLSPEEIQEAYKIINDFIGYVVIEY